MLTAAVNGKLKRQVSLWEDEVTSCIFGEMRHLNASSVWRIFRHLAETAHIGDLIRSEEMPDKVEFEFWPKTGLVEPDLMVHFYKRDLSLLHIIVEVKWGAKLSPKCELVRQWGHRPTAEDNWVHLYLVKDVSTGIGEIASSLAISKSKCTDERYSCCDVDTKKRDEISAMNFSTKDWQNHLGCIGWRDVIEATRGVDEIHKGIRIFFEKQGIEVFSGFSQLSDEKLLGENYIFFKQ